MSYIERYVLELSSHEKIVLDNAIARAINAGSIDAKTFPGIHLATLKNLFNRLDKLELEEIDG